MKGYWGAFWVATSMALWVIGVIWFVICLIIKAFE